MATKTVINTGIQKGYLENSLTQDISSLEAIYDLIDNSIDAARRDIFADDTTILDEYGMPSDYTGYEIDITVTDKKIMIKDNCSGFSANDLASRAFFIGSPSSHDFGIGQYGIGLKRALLKMGNEYDFLTDNGTQQITAHLTKDDLTTDKTITPKVQQSDGNTKSYFAITKLKDTILPDITAELWYDHAYIGIQQRYTIYLEKGLIINIKYQNNPREKVEHRFVAIREDGNFKPLKFGYYVEDGVYIAIEAGIHADYRFKGEADYNLAVNRKLTDDFGIYIICNDRVIVSSSTEKKYGWATKWHSEYNGFVCIVRFISSDPTLLPINTAKTEITTDAHLFLKVAQKIQPIANDYRSKIAQRYKGDNSEIQFGDNLDFLDQAKPFAYSGSKPQKLTTKTLTVQSKTTAKTQKTPKIITKKPNKIPINNDLVKALNKLNHRKLSEFYQSICKLPVDSYPSLISVSLSVFYETLGNLLGKKDGVEIKGYFSNQKVQTLVTKEYPSKKLKDFHKGIEQIQDEGNLTKHTGNFSMVTAQHLVPYMEMLAEITIDMIETYLQKPQEKPTS